MAQHLRPALTAWLQASVGARQALLAALALLTLAGTLGANLLLWPIEYLGYDVDLRSGQVTWVAPGGPAAQAGLRAGDRLISVYGRPWPEVLYHWNRWLLIEASGPAIAMSAERAGVLTDYQLPRRPPDRSYQVAKVVFAVLAAACWVTGYRLGLVRRHEVNASWPIAAFWLLLAGVLGSYVFAVDLSLPLLALLLWLMITVLPALGVYIHVTFPARAVALGRIRWARRALIGSWAGAQVLLAGAWLIGRLSLADMVAQAWPLVVLGLGGAFLGSGLLLAEAYRQVVTAHVRRQIRLIAAACFLVAALWLLLRIVPLLLRVPAPIPEALIDLAPILIPLAYLVSGTVPNLYTLDRLARRAVALTVAVGITATLIGASIALLPPTHPTLLIGYAVAAGLLFQPIAAWARRQLARPDDPDRSHEPLRQARQQLTTSLDPGILGAAIQAGIQASFHRPPFALYHAAAAGASALALTRQDGLPDLPQTIPAGLLTAHLSRGEAITEARTLHRALASTQLSAAEEAAVRHQGVALWGAIRRGPEELLGVVLIGTDGNLDPYRSADRRAIQELLAAAALAFANSAAYERQRQTERTLRELFHAMRRVQDETAAALAREVHDEIINVHVQLNIVTLQQLQARVTDREVQGELALLLASEQGVSEALRVICERLHPTGLNDRFGLVGVLRAQVERVRALWPGTCALVVEGAARPIEPETQREVFRIAREALANAVKHAAATMITVRLQYPAASGGPITLSILDNGRTGQVVGPKAGHWGLRNMYESARAAGGTLQIDQVPEGGTRVAVTFPAALE